MPRNLRPSTTNARQHGYQPYPPRPRSEHATTRASTQWPKADDELLFDLRAKGTSWKDIAELIGHDRTQEACRQRHKRKGEEKKRDATFDPNVLARAYVENHEAMFSMVVRNMPGVDWQEAERFVRLTPHTLIYHMLIQIDLSIRTQRHLQDGSQTCPARARCRRQRQRDRHNTPAYARCSC